MLHKNAIAIIYFEKPAISQVTCDQALSLLCLIQNVLGKFPPKT